MLQHRHVPHPAGLVLASLRHLEQPLSFQVAELVAAGGVGVVQRELVEVEFGTHPLAIAASEGDVLVRKAAHVVLNLGTNNARGEIKRSQAKHSLHMTTGSNLPRYKTAVVPYPSLKLNPSLP